MPVSRNENDAEQFDLGTPAVSSTRASATAPPTLSLPAPTQRTSTGDLPSVSLSSSSPRPLPDVQTDRNFEPTSYRLSPQQSRGRPEASRYQAAPAHSLSERTPIVRHTRRLPVVSSVQRTGIRAQGEREGEGREESHTASAAVTRASSGPIGTRPSTTSSSSRYLSGGNSRGGNVTASEPRESTRFPLLDSSRWLERQRLAGNEDIRTRIQARAIFARWTQDFTLGTRSSSPRTASAGVQRQGFQTVRREGQAERVRDAASTDAGSTSSARAQPAPARDRQLSSPSSSSSPTLQGTGVARSLDRMDSRDRNGASPGPNSSVHDYAGWAPGTTTSENPRPTLNALYAMASRNIPSSSSSSFSTAATPAVLNGHDPAISGSSASNLTSFERRYNTERQHRMDMLDRQFDMAADYRRNNVQLQSSSYYPSQESQAFAPGSVGSAGVGSNSSNNVGAVGGGFASTVVDAEGNPIDTGISNELPNPRSIVYNPPPSTRSVRSSSQLASQLAARMSSLARSHIRAGALDEADLVERYLASSSANLDTPASEDSTWARYTEMQRQEQLESRRQRAVLRADHRADQRLERLRRAGASTSNAPRPAPVWAGDRTYPLGELRRDLHELHRDRHPAVSPPNSSSDAAKDGLKRAIQYLHRIRTVAGECETESERMQAAREEGFGPGASGTENLDHSDLVKDLSQLGPLPETSWLVPGTVFQGSQRAITVSTITNVLGHSSPYSLAAHHISSYTAAWRERYGRPADISSYPRRLNPALLEPGRRSAATDPNARSLIDSVMQHDEHAGTASAEPGWASQAARSRFARDPMSFPAFDSLHSGGSNDRPRQDTGNSGTRRGGEEAAASESRPKPVEGEDTWPVKVRITSVDYNSMKLTGTMEAMNVPNRTNNGAGGDSTLSSAGASTTARTESDRANRDERRRRRRRRSSIGDGAGGAGKEEGGGDGQGGSGRRSGQGAGEGEDNEDDDGEDEDNKNTITTFLEGEILDLQHFSLETGGYKADSSIDGTYWRRLEPFRSLKDEEIVAKVLSLKWLKDTVGKEYLLMRWKEKCFVDPSHANQGLTISGFYYISLHRPTGRIEGLYYDPQSSPYQHLCLTPAIRHFSSYTFQ